jgi:hypothetical protein
MTSGSLRRLSARTSFARQYAMSNSLTKTALASEQYVTELVTADREWCQYAIDLPSKRKISMLTKTLTSSWVVRRASDLCCHSSRRCQSVADEESREEAGHGLTNETPHCETSSGCRRDCDALRTIGRGDGNRSSRKSCMQMTFDLTTLAISGLAMVLVEPRRYHEAPGRLVLLDLVCA